MIISIKKRDGRVVPFDPSKIEHAIAHCFMGSGSQKSDETAQELAALVVSQLENDENIPSVPSVEQVQDVVERVLIEKGFVRSAKAYILYRAERSRVREMNTRLMKVFEDIASKDAVDSDIKRENANINGDTAMGSMLKFGSEGAKQFYEMYVLDPRFSAAHHDGDIHIHDLDFYTLTTTCCQIDLVKLFHDGFSTGHGFIRQPKSIATYASLACIAIQANQNEMHGGQAVPNFDYAMAEGVACTFRKEYYDAVQRYFWLEYDCENVLGEAFRSALKDAMPDRINMSNIDDHEELLVQWLLETGEQWLGKTPAEEEILKTHTLIGASLLKNLELYQNEELVQTAYQICRWHHERYDGRGYPDGLKGEEIPICAQVVSIVDVYDALTSERCYKKAFDHDTAIQMILDGQCGQFNPILLKCLKELSFQLSKMLDKGMEDNEYYHEIQRLSNEILSDRSLPNQNYSQSVVKVMQEKIDFFKSNSGMNSIDYNAISGQLTILNGKQQIICQRNNPKIDLFKEFGVNEEDAQYIRVLLHQTSVQNKEISVQIKAVVENDGRMYKLKLHTLWSPLKKDGYIGIIGYVDSVK